MARKLRIAYPGALYHVINRGNYRADVFDTEGAKTAFLQCLWELAFERMSRSWALGTKDFVRALAEDHKEQLVQQAAVDQDARELREAAWEDVLERCLKAVGKDETAIAQDRKAAAWKVGVAVAMRAGTTVTNPWLAQRLNMGAADGVSRYVAETRRGQRPEAMQVAEKLGTTNIRV